LPIEAVPTALIRAFAMKNNARSKMKATRATAAAKPDIQELQQVMAISRMWASKPNTAAPVARARATMCNTRT
jgi:hypothetical protein